MFERRLKCSEATKKFIGQMFMGKVLITPKGKVLREQAIMNPKRIQSLQYREKI